MSQKDLEIELLEFNKGVHSAKNVLASWDIPEPEIHQGVSDNIQDFLDRLFKVIRSGKGVSDYELGYFSTLKRRNDPELNRLLTAFQLQISNL